MLTKEEIKDYEEIFRNQKSLEWDEFKKMYFLKKYHPTGCIALSNSKFINAYYNGAGVFQCFKPHYLFKEYCYLTFLDKDFSIKRKDLENEDLDGVLFVLEELDKYPILDEDEFDRQLTRVIEETAAFLSSDYPNYTEEEIKRALENVAVEDHEQLDFNDKDLKDELERIRMEELSA